RFVAGFSGEQFALPEAVPLLRRLRKEGGDGSLISISGADPLNLVGVLTDGEKVPAVSAHRVLYRDGVPVAARIAGETRFFERFEEKQQWRFNSALLERDIPAAM